MSVNTAAVKAVGWIFVICSEKTIKLVVNNTTQKIHPLLTNVTLSTTACGASGVE
jgi:hypothetical protein